MTNIKFTVKKLTYAAVIAAVYVAITISLAMISFGPLQFRVSEALCILPFFFPAAVPGLFVGCLIANLMTGNILDIVFGSLATLIAAIMTMKIKIKWLACLPPAIINGIIVGAVLAQSFNPEAFWTYVPVYGFQVFVGELGVLYLVGLPLMYALPKFKFFRALYEKDI